ncbi:Cadherin-like, partial [Algoriphagus locisalis]
MLIFGSSALMAQGNTSYEFPTGSKVTLNGAALELSNRSSFSLEFWANFSTTSGIVNLVDFSGGLEAGGLVLMDGKLTVDLSCDFGCLTTSEAISVNIGEWYHIAVVFDSGLWDFYVDGTARGTNLPDQGAHSTVPNYTSLGVTDLVFGFQNHSAVNDFAGKIDDIRLWSSARTQSEIQNNRSKEIAGNEAGLIGYWKLNESSGTTVSDSQTNATALNGTSSGVLFGRDGAFQSVAQPTVNTTVASSITATGATLTSEVAADGGATVTERGFVYATTTNPTTANTKVPDDGTGTGAFTENITGLTAGTTYYVRAYATNNAGTNYGDQVSFTTGAPALAPLQSLYWPNENIDKIEGISLTGSSRQDIVTIASSGSIIAIDIDQINEKAYWFDQTDSKIYRSNLDGTSIEEFVSNPGYATTIFVDHVNEYLYWPNYEGSKIERIKLDGTGREDVISASDPIGISVDVSGSKVYWYDQTNGSIYRGNLDGSGSEEFISNPGFATTLYIDQKNNHLYWPNNESSKIERIKLDGTGREDVISATDPIGISVDVSGSKVYWYDQTNGSIYRGNLDGTGSEEFISDPGYATTLSIPWELPANTLPTVGTSLVSSITATGATLSSEVTSDGGAIVDERGFVYATSSNPTTSDIKLQDGSGTGSFEEAITGLTAGTTYYVRAYATNSAGSAYGNEVSFTTGAASGGTECTVSNPFDDSSDEVFDGHLGQSFVACESGTLKSIGLLVTAGSTNTNETINIYSGSSTSPGNLLGTVTGQTLTENGGNPTNYAVVDFSSENVNVLSGQTYTFDIPTGANLVFTNDNGYTIGGLFYLGSPFGGNLDLVFEVVIESGASSTTPTIATSVASEITATTATLSGNVTDDGGAEITARGIEYSTTNGFAEGTGTPVAAPSASTGEFTVATSGLVASTTYYYRAYATNSEGTSYGDQVSFETNAPTIPLTINANNGLTLNQGTTQFIGSGDLNISYDETFVASDITFTITSAVSYGVLFIDSNQNFLVDDGEVELVENSTFTAEEIDGERFSYKNTSANQSADSFVFKVSDPNGGELNNQTFSITINLPEVPTVTTTTASGITATAATLGGNVTDDGGANVTERGIVYNTTGTPTTADTKVQIGNGTGEFSQEITGLSANTEYFVRAYAINDEGTSYGDQVSFTTLLPQNPPSITSTPLTTIPYGQSYQYSIEASIENDLETTLTAPTLPFWLTFSLDGQSGATLFGNVPAGVSLTGVAGDDEGNIYAIRSNATEIFKIQPDGTTTSWKSGMHSGSVYALHIANGYVYIPRYYNSTHSITRVPLNDPSAAEEVFLSREDGALSLTDKDGFIYAANIEGNEILKINESTKAVEVLLNSTNGIPNWGPFGLTFDELGNLYIATWGDRSILKYDGTTLSTVLSGLPNDVSSIRVDKKSNFFLSMSGGGVRKYTSDFSSFQVVSLLETDNVWSLSFTSSGALVYSKMGTNEVYRLQTGAILTGTPAKSDTGEHPVVLRASNSNGFTEQEFTITVTDETGPIISALNPESNATDVALQPTLSMTFDEEVVLGNTGVFSLGKVAEDGCTITPFLEFDLSDPTDKSAFTLSEDKLTVSLTITENLTVNTRVVMAVPAGFVLDSLDNSFAGFTANTYTWSFTTLNKNEQAITFPEIGNKTTADPAFTLGEAETDQGLTVTYTAADPTVVSITGNQATILKAGSTLITATQEGDDLNFAAQPVERTLTVSGPPSITSTPILTTPYGQSYQYSIEASIENDLETTLTAPTLPAWLTFSLDGQSDATLFGNVPAGIALSGVASDDEGNIYAIRSDGAEIFKIQPDGTTTSWKSGMHSGSVYSLHIANGYIYIPRYGNSTQSITRVPVNDPSAPEETFLSRSGGIMSLTDKDGFIYASNYAGIEVLKINEANKTVEVLLNSTNGLSSNRPFGLTFDEDENLYISTLSTTLLKYDGTTVSTVLSGLPSATTSVKLDKNTNFYISFAGGGVRKYTSDFSSSHVVSLLPTDNVWSISFTSSGALVYAKMGTNEVYRIQTGAMLKGTAAKSDLGDHSVVLRAENEAGFTEQEFTITITDETGPIISALNPENNATDVALQPTLSMTFDEEVVLGNTGVFSLGKVAEDGCTITPFLEFDLSDPTDKSALTLSEDKLTVSLTITENLPVNTRVVMAVPAGFVLDSLDNSFAGFTANTYSWSFTTINKVEQTITFGEIEQKTYGDASFTLGNAETDQGLSVTYTAADPTVVSITGNQATILKPGSTTITASQDGDDTRFPAENVERTLTVAKKGLTLNVDADQSKVYGQTDPALTYTLTAGELVGEDAFT